MSNPMEDIMNGIVAAADKETPDTIAYKDLLSANKDSSAYEIMNTFDMAASEPVFTVVKIIKQKYGITRMSDELYWFIRDFPAYIHKLEREIEAAEGSVCCVDKAWSRSMKKLDELVKANQLEQGSNT